MKEKVFKELQEVSREMELSIRDTMIEVLYYTYKEVVYDDDTVYAILEEMSDEELFQIFCVNYNVDMEM